MSNFKNLHLIYPQYSPYVDNIYIHLYIDIMDKKESVYTIKKLNNKHLNKNHIKCCKE